MESETYGLRSLLRVLLSQCFALAADMADPGKVREGTPRHHSSSASSSSDRKRREKAPPDVDSKKRKDDPAAYGVSPRGESVAAAQAVEDAMLVPPVPGPSSAHDTSHHSFSDDKYDRLSALVSGLLEKLNKGPDTDASRADFSGFHDVSSSEDEGGHSQPVPDCLDELDQLASPTADPTADGDDSDFLQALEELSGHFHGEEAKGKPLSERLATILNASLRRRPTSEGVRLTCEKIRLPSNVPNLTVPSTNTALTKAMSIGGKLIDARLTHTNGLLSKAVVPIAQCINDIGEKKGNSIGNYLPGLNNSLRLLTSAVNYLNQLRKEVARIHVHDSALVDLCKWDCEVGTDALFPFDIAKKCDEIHKTKKLGRPIFRPSKTAGPRRYAPHRQAPRRSYTQQFPRHSYAQQDRPRNQNKPFLGQRASQGRGTHKHTSSQ